MAIQQYPLNVFDTVTTPNSSGVVVTVTVEKQASMAISINGVIVLMMMSAKPGGVETIGSCLRLKVPDPSTLRPATEPLHQLPCYSHLVTSHLPLPCFHYSHSSHVQVSFPCIDLPLQAKQNRTWFWDQTQEKKPGSAIWVAHNNKSIRLW